MTIIVFHYAHPIAPCTMFSVVHWYNTKYTRTFQHNNKYVSDCKEPPTVANSTTGKTNENTYPSVATYTCDDGYTPSGNHTSTCQASGTWTDVSFNCAGKGIYLYTAHYGFHK